MLSVSSRDGDYRRKSCPATVNDDLRSEKGDPLFTPLRSCSITDADQSFGIEDPLKGKQQAHQKLRRFEDELKRTFAKVKMMNHFRNKTSSTSSNNSQPGTPQTPDATPLGSSVAPGAVCQDDRSLHVIHSNALLKMNNKKHKHSLAVEFLLSTENEYEHGDRNANPILSLGSLRNGRFSAGIALNNFPPGGELVIRVSGYKLDFFWMAQRPKQTRRSSSQNLQNTKPLHCNNVDLPMYVDPQNLDFNLDHNTKITVSGKTKGFLTRRKSISTDDLAINKQFMKTPKQSKRAKTVKKKSVLDQTADQDARDRSYTR